MPQRRQPPWRSPGKVGWASAGLLLATAALLLPAPAQAAKVKVPAAGEVAERRSDLGELRERLEQLKREVAAGESSRAEAADQLRDSERAISDLQRDMHDLGEQRRELEAALRDLGQQTRGLEADLASQQSRLEQLLVRQYVSATPDTLRLALSGRDPNQVARDLHYLNVIARARAGLLREIETLLTRKRGLATETRQQALALADVEARQRQRHAQVARERDGRKLLLTRLSANISSQHKEIGALRRNEQRLARLVDRLAKLAASMAAARPAKRPAVPDGAAQSTPAPDRQNVARPVENRETPPAGLSGAFAKLRGSLRLPVAGAVAGRFGAAREGGGTWKGVFIRAATGGEVKAIAPGQVVFADWMRGFGNLLILDHGDGYLSIYGYNDALLRNLGDEVRSGDAIASVGNSGGYPESGLYFEIRHQGQPQDPLKWAGAR